MTEVIVAIDPIGEGLAHHVMREHVVRCRDCDYSEIDRSDHEYREPRWCKMHETDVADDWFCSWGKRRDA